jgi:hypothetical protein
MNSRNRINVVASAALAMAFGMQVHAQDKPVEIGCPAQHPLAKTGFEPWAKSVEAASKGSIKVTLFPAQQLGKAADHYDMARDGIADLTWVNPGYQAGRFPHVCRQRAAVPHRQARPRLGRAGCLVPQARQQGNEGCEVLPGAHPRRHAAFQEADHEPGQIKGMKIRPPTAPRAVHGALGGTNVQVSAPESRDALEKGVADAITFPWDSSSPSASTRRSSSTPTPLYAPDFRVGPTRASTTRAGLAARRR